MAKSKLNSIETLVSHALIGTEKSHDEFVTIMRGKDNYEKIKKNLRNVREENMRLNSVNSRT